MCRRHRPAPVWAFSRKLTTMTLMSLTDLQELAERQSDDPHTKVACRVTTPDGTVLLEAANTFTHGAVVTPQMLERPEKYDWIEHAERNAIFAAARQGLALQGQEMHLTGFPCVECARAIAQSGIATLHHGSTTGFDDARYKFSKSREILERANVRLIERAD